MRTSILSFVIGIAMATGAGSALAWDLHDTLAPGPTPPTADAPPPTESVPGGADLQLPDVVLPMPDVTVSRGAPALESRCQEAIARHGEHSAEAWTQC